MAMTAERKEQVREIAHHPVKWMKGNDLPAEEIRPWEQATHIVSGAVNGLRDHFRQNQMTMFQNVFGIAPRLQAIGVAVTTIWDGFNDPIIGAWMDHKNFPIATHKKVMRWNVLISSLLVTLLFFNFNMTHMQHIVLYIILTNIKSLSTTAASVSGAKVWAHITPHSRQRSKIAWASTFGWTLHEALGGLYYVIIGMREYIHDWTGMSEYQIYVLCAIVCTIPCLFTEMLPSFVLQRVPDKKEKPEGEVHFFREIKECFVLVRHNKWFVLNTLNGFINALLPAAGELDFYRYCKIDETLNMGKVKGETLLWLRSNVAAAPGMLIQPFTLRIMNKLGGARNTVLLNQGFNALMGISRSLIGVKTIPRVLFMWFTEMMEWTTNKPEDVARKTIEFDMLDYVEWKTGRRSEGITFAVRGLIEKMTIGPLRTMIGRLFLEKIGFDPALEVRGLPQSPLYIKWAVWTYLWVMPIRCILSVIIFSFYKYPAEMRDRVEVDLIERRRLAEEKKAELEEVSL